MIKCPKCNFEQPQDQYCAKCGIDIFNYTAPSPSLFKRAATNSVFHISLFIAIVISVITWVQNDRQEELRSRVAFLQGQSSSQNSTEVQVDNQVQKKLISQQNLPKKKSSPIAKTNPALANRFIAKSKQSTSPTGASIYFVEISHTSLQNLLDNSQNPSQDFSNFKTIKVSKLFSQLQKGLGSNSIKVLHKITKRLSFQPNQWFLGAEGVTGDDDIGLTTLLTYQSYGSFPIEGEIELLTSFYSNFQDEYPVKESFQDNFSLNQNQGLLITGVILPRKLNGEEQELYKQSILKIFLSEKFQNKRSFFAIAIIIHSD